MAAMASNSNSNSDRLPVIPLSHIAKRYNLSLIAKKKASEELKKAKESNPPTQINVLRRCIEQERIETNSLDELKQRMSSVKAATPLFFSPDILARQIAVIDCQLYGHALLDKASLSQLDQEQTKLGHLIDFHHYLTHSLGHQLIYWGELLVDSSAASSVVPPVNPNKDSLATHLIRVALLLLHAYRDFSGFAAVMKALMLPEVSRIKRLWASVPSKTREVFRELSLILSPQNSYQAYYELLRSKLKMHVKSKNQANGSGRMMIAVPWIEPHLLSVKSIVAAYTAGDNEEDAGWTGGRGGYFTVEQGVILSDPGARKLDTELAFLEICQHNSIEKSTSDDLIDEILSFRVSDVKKKRASMAASKMVHIDGLPNFTPATDLNNLAPEKKEDQLAHHWLVSRVYLRKDQLIEESIAVEPLKPGEVISDNNRFDESRHLMRFPSAISTATSRRTSFAPPSPVITTTSSAVAIASVDDGTEFVEQEMVSMTRPKENPSQQNDKDDKDDSSNAGGSGGLGEANVVSKKQQVEKPLAETAKVADVEHEVTPAKELATITTEQEPQNEPNKLELLKSIKNEDEDEFLVVEIDEQQQQPEAKISAVEKQVKVGKKQRSTPITISSISEANKSQSVLSQSTSASKQKSRLSPTAPEFVPTSSVSNHGRQKPTTSAASTTTSTDEKWLGYPIKEEEDDEELLPTAAVRSTISAANTGSEKWNGYPTPAQDENAEEDEEVWKGYPSPNSNTDSPRRASSQSSQSEEWKGYHATKMEAVWQRESALKVQEHEWQGYALETLNEDELDSSTMMDGQFEKSRQARGQDGREDQVSKNFQKKRQA